MSKKLPALVRVLESALHHNNDYADTNNEVIANHGYLFIPLEAETCLHKNDMPLYTCKSLATGATEHDDMRIQWYADEVEATYAET